MLIVAWCAIVMHARLGRLLDDYGLQLAVVAGNIVTALYWFGVNLLGVGLHSYGFTTNGLFWLLPLLSTARRTAPLRQPVDARSLRPQRGSRVAERLLN